ncbi:hypothetical protein IJI31_05120 [bacterium]|nr:hypothetical protein [bacterium]
MRKIFITLISVFLFIGLLGFVPFNADNILPKIIKETEKFTTFKVNAAGLKISLFKGATISRLDLFYPTGEKFAQFDNINIQISLPSLLKKQATAKKIKSETMVLKLKAKPNGELYINDFINLSDDAGVQFPDFIAEKYDIALVSDKDKPFYLIGNDLKISKFIPNKRIKFSTNGKVSIQNEDYIDYDINLLSELEMQKAEPFDFIQLLSDIEKLKFKANILANFSVKGTQAKPKADGIINVDGISVTINDKKLPNSFAYLTFLDDKISLDSEIFSDISEKLSAKGLIKIGEKPYVDLKIKTDKTDIKNTFYVFRLLSEITGMEQVKSVSGHLTSDCAIKGDLNKLKSTGYFDLRNINISTNNLLISNLNSYLDFSDNIIKIKQATAYVNGALVNATGKIDKNIDIQITANKVPVKKLLENKYGITNGIVSVIANITGTMDNIIPKFNVQISGFSGNHEDCKYNVNNILINVSANKNIDAKLMGVILNQPNICPIKIPTLTLAGNTSDIEIKKSPIYAQNSKIDISGKLLNLMTDKFMFFINGDGYIKPSDFNIKELTETQPILLTITGNEKIQNFNIQLLQNSDKLFGTASIINFWGKLAGKELKINDLSINTYNGKFDKSNLRQNIATAGKLLVVNGTITDLKNPVLHTIKINIPKHLKLYYGDASAQLQGDLLINGTIKSPEIVGQLNVNKLLAPKLELSLEKLEADFTKNMVEISCPNIKIKNSTMNITALADPFKNVIKNLNIKSKVLNTNDLLEFKNNFNLPHPYIHNGIIYAEKVIVQMYDKALILTDFNSALTTEGPVYKIQNIYADMYNGKIAGKVDFNTDTDKFSTNLQARGVSSQLVLNEITDLKENISGTMDFDAGLSGWIGAKDSIAGNIKFIINDGQMPTLGKLEHLLYAQNIIADNMLRTSLSVITKAITAKNTGLFKYIKGTISLANGWAKIDSIQTLGPTMSMYIKGRINIVNNFADLTILGRLSDEVITSLGAVGNFSMNKLMSMITGYEESAVLSFDFMDHVPMLPQKNTKEFKSVIYGPIEKQSSVKLFKWVSYSEKTYNTKEVPMQNYEIPDFINNIGR